ncbi:leucine-rich repeat-containing protein 71-like [Spodoptera frugiperda]|uniref:Leucine-rich repeat-containing protein 71-like n=1 Tax=Spodoptera frugiperda TaxID=7108 RepID=A0A9R0ETI7_SPOFR|nr:leucine-rich repeat-containing protein 71-like [Spodoptera frugiperda]
MDLRFNEEGNNVLDTPTPADFDAYLPWACMQLMMEYNIIITRSYRNPYQPSKEKGKTKSSIKSKMPTETESNESLPPEILLPDDELNAMTNENNVYIETVYDENNKLFRIKFNKNNTFKIPREIFKVIGLIVHFHTSLSSIVINSGLHAAAIYEISKILPKSNITEICLDYSYVSEANYYILLKYENLKHLSLSKCSINDDCLKLITAELSRINPTLKLCALNLATNRITDVGAKYLAEMLRYNRNIGYLNLADNMIGDEGAISILNTLKEFPLTPEEAFERRSRLMVRIKEKSSLLQKTLNNMQAEDMTDKKMSKRKSVKPPLANAVKRKLDSDTAMSKSMEMILYERAEIIVDHIMGPLHDPFSPINVDLRGPTVYCLGNNSLSYLNIAYNNLSQLSIKILCDVLKRQKILGRRPRGLINVVIEGNYLSDNITELKYIDDSIGAILSAYRKLSIETSKRKSISPRLN